jgi:hypothetical protein
VLSEKIVKISVKVLPLFEVLLYILVFIVEVHVFVFTLALYVDTHSEEAKRINGYAYEISTNIGEF